jgi:hypothetical protein
MSKRRFAALAMSIAVAGAVTALPAGAADEVKTPEKFAGDSTATALDLSVFGNPVTLGFTKVTGDSTVKAVAEGAGQLLDGQATKAEAASPGQKEDPAESCGPLTLPPEVPAIDLQTVCSNVLAETPGGLPHALSQASIAELGVSADELFAQTPLKEVKEGAQEQVITPLFEGLAEVFKQLEGTPIEKVPATLEGLLNDVLETKTLAVKVGPSSSEVTTTAKNIVSTASAQGAVIEVLPTAVIDPKAPTAPGKPVLTIEVGAAKATATRDRETNKNEGTFDPALVRVTLDETIATGLGIPEGQNVVEVKPGQSECLLADTPLESCISVAAGSVTEGEDGSVKAIADAVSLHLLKGLPEPSETAGIKLALAHAEAGIAGAPEVRVQSAPPAVPQELPRTGGPEGLPYIAGGLVVLALGLRWLAGRRTA